MRQERRRALRKILSRADARSGNNATGSEIHEKRPKGRAGANHDGKRTRAAAHRVCAA